MSHRPVAELKVLVLRALVVLALPVACATGTEPEAVEGDGPSDNGGSAGQSAGGSPGSSGSMEPKAGTTSTAGKTGAFGGTSSDGGSTSTAGTGGTAGKASGGAGGGGGASGSGGASAGSGGASAGSGGSGTGSCECPKTVAWTDGMNISLKTGDCVTADGKTFLYTGPKEQTWAHPDCRPGAQKMTWCTQSGSDYVFMPCN